MFFRYWCKGNKIYGSVVKSVRVDGKVTQETVAYLGELKEDQIPYLKAAYSKHKPKLVYEEGENSGAT